jgi:hypothetical protein
MKITICGSIAFIDNMVSLKTDLEKLGHEVYIPPVSIVDDQGKPLDVKEYYRMRHTEIDPKSWIWDKKKEAMLLHFNKVALAEAILVLNMDKNGIAGYIGPNTFMEMGLALYLNKKIFIYNPLPAASPYYEELLGCQGTVLEGNLEKITA